MTLDKGTRWDKDEFSRLKRITVDDKRRMAAYIHAGLNMGKLRDDLLEELAQKYERSTRQIERYIAAFSSSDKPIHQDGRVPDEAVQQKAERKSEEEAKHPENRWPVQEILVERGVLELAATFKDELSRINALDDAVWQLLGAPWLSSERPEKASVLYVSRYPELKVILTVEHGQLGQFLVLTEQLEPISPGFGEDFREWEHQSLTPFIRRCQEITREIWYQAESNEWGLKMGVDNGYGYMINVPLFIYRFALEHCAESTSPVPVLEIPPVDLGRFPGVPPHYQQLTRQDDLEFILAVGLPQVMNSCGLFTIELCKQYAQDNRIRKIIEEEKTLKKQTESFRKVLSEFLSSRIGKRSQGTERLGGARVLEPSQVQQLIQQWRNIFQSLSPIQLLEWLLNNATSEALNDFFTNVAQQKATYRARQRHFVRLTWSLNRDPVYLSLRERFPQSSLLATLNASLDAWQKCEPTCTSAFFDLIDRVKELVKVLMDSIFHTEDVNDGNLAVCIETHRREIAYVVLITCDLLMHYLSEPPSDVRWWSLINGLEKLRVRVNLELSFLTGKTGKGGWPSNAEFIWADPEDSLGLVQRTRTYLNELAKLRAAQDSLETALRELESTGIRKG